MENNIDVFNIILKANHHSAEAKKFADMASYHLKEAEILGEKVKDILDQQKNENTLATN